MLFALLVLFSAFLIEGIGTYVSVVGLSSLFAANTVIITLAIALDLGKIVTVSFLYKYWKKINWLMKSYMCVAAVVLMTITSAGAFGFLSGEFQKAIADTSSQNVVMTTLTDEQTRLQARKNEIDKQISQLKSDNVRGRTQLMRQFGPEVGRINKRLEEIDVELPKLKVESIKKNVEVGPIIYVAEAFNTTPEQAVKWVILTIIFVFDPLAVALLVAGNYLLELRKKQDDETPTREDRAKTLSEEVLEKMKERKLEEEKQIEQINQEVLNEAITNFDNQADTIPVIEETQEPVVETPAEETTIELTQKETEEEITEQPQQAVEEEKLLLPQIESIVNAQVENEAAKSLADDILKVVKGDNIPQLSSVQEAPVLDIADEEFIEPENREVITLEQITRPHAIPKSSLEGVDGSKGDIFTDDEDRSRAMHNTFTIYRD